MTVLKNKQLYFKRKIFGRNVRGGSVFSSLLKNAGDKLLSTSKSIGKEVLNNSINFAKQQGPKLAGQLMKSALSSNPKQNLLNDISIFGKNELLPFAKGQLSYQMGNLGLQGQQMTPQQLAFYQNLRHHQMRGGAIMSDSFDFIQKQSPGMAQRLLSSVLSNNPKQALKDNAMDIIKDTIIPFGKSQLNKEMEKLGLQGKQMNESQTAFYKLLKKQQKKSGGSVKRDKIIDKILSGKGINIY